VACAIVGLWSGAAPVGASPSVPVPVVSRVLTTMTDDARSGQLDTTGAVGWYQGESDAVALSEADACLTNLSALISTLRDDLPMDPSTPMMLAKESLAGWLGSAVYAGLCAQVDCTAIEQGDGEVRAADDWAAANLPHVVADGTIDLPRTGVLMHLCNVGDLAIGARIAQASVSSMP
jgi:hypothetical protein